MTKEIKKVGLLKDTGPSKKAAPVQTSATQTEAAKNIMPSAKDLSNKPKSKGKLGLIILLTILIVLVFAPKPELIVYRKMNIQASSIYWPGFMGRGAKLLDSELAVTIDEARREMTLCFENNKNCQKYHIERQEGLVGVLKHLLQ